MSESNQEGYQTLGWIINKSEQGLFIVVADEIVQKEIVDIYRQGAVGIYDYKQHLKEYSFRDLQEWVTGLPEIQIFIIANFHLAVQDEESLKRLNFSRDMIERLGKNFIFLVTPYGDDRLASGAYDFYSFVKLRVIFHNYEINYKKNDKLLSLEDIHDKEEEWEPEKLKQKLAETYILIEQAKDERNKAHYCESEKILLKVRKIKEKLLGTEHLEIAEVNYELAEVYKEQGKYKEAEELNKKSLSIREKVLGEEHPDTAASYNNLAGVYESQGKHKISLDYCYKAYKILVSILGINHPNTQIVYENLEFAYKNYNPEGCFEQWLEEKMKETE
ncbi:MAG: tetratricopeptide repeat protein [Eubacterium sp.]|nr:tetratricopeptide repeat protein [Eubacterium sp.]